MQSRSELTIILRALVHEVREGQYLTSQLPEAIEPFSFVRTEPRAPRNGEAELIARYADRLMQVLGTRATELQSLKRKTPRSFDPGARDELQ